MVTATVVKRKDIAKGHFLLWFRSSQPFTFEPGQYLTMGKEGTERPYSIVSAPHEKDIELFLEMVPKELETEKSLTPKLHSLKIGDTVSLRPKAKGRFVLNVAMQTHVMIATVTGIAPFISMIRAYLHGYYHQIFERPFYVFQGSSYVDEFGYYEELCEATKTGKLVYIPTISRPNEARNAEWQGTKGRVNLILDEYFKKFNIVADEKTMVYLCGNKGMIENLGNKRETPQKPLGTLIKAGFKVKEEIFF